MASACLSLGVPSSAGAAYPGDDGLVAFVGTASGAAAEFDIYTIRPDGSGLQEIDDGATWEYDPAWSADGTKLVFSRSREIIVRDFLSGQETVIAQASTDRPHPYFSPSGNRIVFSDFARRGSKIETVSATGGSKPRMLVSARRGRGEGVNDPEYSPDGKRIVFSGVPPGEKRQGIWTMRRNGTQFRQLTDPRRVDRDAGDAHPTVAPDGRHVVFERSIRRSRELVRVGIDGKRERLLKFYVESPAYAPSGRSVAGTYWPFAPASCSEIFVAGVNASSGRFVTNNCGQAPSGLSGAATPSWQPLP